MDLVLTYRVAVVTGASKASFLLIAGNTGDLGPARCHRADVVTEEPAAKRPCQ